jgi:7-carboxy-7-deazaguanine synthase
VLYIHEIFPSFQGEGVLVGAPQIFLRLSGCNLRCSYCDTPQSRERTESFWIEGWERRLESFPNPAEVTELAEIVSSLWDASFHSISVTGGEPMLQSTELATLLPLFKEKGMRVYLETNGTLYAGLGDIVAWVDWIAMDVKLPSTQEGTDLLEEHRLFLRQALHTNVFLKMVIDAGTDDDEFARACRILGEEAGEVSLILQPATRPQGEEGISTYRAAELHQVASSFFSEVRVIPQMHLVWGAK